MANFKQKFGSDKVVKNTNDNDTPQQKRFESATGKDSDSAVGDVNKKDTVPSNPSKSGVDAPSGTNKGVWASAEAAVLNMSGGFAGVSKEGRKRQIQDQYDKIVESDKQTRKWAAGSGILGDIGEDKKEKK